MSPPGDILLTAAHALCAIGRRIDARGWCPATSGNFSVRLDASRVLMTASGRDKGALVPEDIVEVDLEGHALRGGRPSAETLLHTHLYRRDPAVGAVLHVHPPASSAYSASVREPTVSLTGWELLKALPGVLTHEAVVEVPRFENTQDIAALAHEVDRWLDTHDAPPAYLIAGHGLYAWGVDLASAWRHLEAVEHLIGLELARASFGARA